MDNSIYVGDVGTDIILDCGSPLSSATVLKILFKRPDKTTGEWVASSVPGNPNQLHYVLQTGDVAVPGVWILQAFVTMPGWSGKGKVVKLTVHPAFE